MNAEACTSGQVEPLRDNDATQGEFSPPADDPELAVSAAALSSVSHSRSVSFLVTVLGAASLCRQPVVSLIEMPSFDQRGQWNQKVSLLELGAFELAGGDLMTLECMDLVVASGPLRLCHVPLGLGLGPPLDETPGPQQPEPASVLKSSPPLISLPKASPASLLSVRGLVGPTRGGT